MGRRIIEVDCLKLAVRIVQVKGKPVCLPGKVAP